MKLKSIFLSGIFCACFVLLSSAAFAFTATGEWTFSDPNAPQSGTIKLEFPVEGGSVNGHMTGGSSQFSLSYESFLEGNFTGGLDGTFDGTLFGGIFYSWVDPRTGQSVPTQKDFTGTWTGKLSKDGVISISISSEGSSSNFSFGFDVENFNEELEVAVGPEEPSGLNPVKKGEWKAGVTKQSYEVYAIIDGKEVRIDTPEFQNSLNALSFAVEPGMTIFTKYKESEAEIIFPDGSSIGLSGEGSKVTILPGENGTYALMGPGKMIVQYETGNKSGTWMSGGEKSEEIIVEGSEDKFDMLYVMFTTPLRGDIPEMADAIGNVGGLRDFGYKAPPLPSEYDPQEDNNEGFWGLLFGNHSVVDYDYDGENVTVKVYEGNVDVMKIDLKTKERVKVADVLPGESFQLSLSDFFKNEGENNFQKSEFSLGLWNEILTFVKSPWGIGIGGGVIILLVVVIIFVVRKKP